MHRKNLTPIEVAVVSSNALLRHGLQSMVEQVPHAHLVNLSNYETPTVRGACCRIAIVADEDVEDLCPSIDCNVLVATRNGRPVTRLDRLGDRVAGIIDQTDCDPVKLGHAIENCAQGFFHAPNGKVSEMFRQRVAPMAPSEVRILKLIADGHNNEQISRSLHVSIHTVKRQVAVVISKLDATNRTDAVIRAIHAGILCCPCRQSGSHYAQQRR